jgi:hypothetical protein
MSSLFRGPNGGLLRRIGGGFIGTAGMVPPRAPRLPKWPRLRHNERLPTHPSQSGTGTRGRVARLLDLSLPATSFRNYETETELAQGDLHESQHPPLKGAAARLLSQPT